MTLPLLATPISGRSTTLVRRSPASVCHANGHGDADNYNHPRVAQRFRPGLPTVAGKEKVVNKWGRHWGCVQGGSSMATEHMAELKARTRTMCSTFPARS